MGEVEGGIDKEGKDIAQDFVDCNRNQKSKGKKENKDEVNQREECGKRKPRRKSRQLQETELPSLEDRDEDQVVSRHHFPPPTCSSRHQLQSNTPPKVLTR